MDGADGVDPDTPEWLVAKEVEVRAPSNYVNMNVFIYLDKCIHIYI